MNLDLWTPEAFGNEFGKFSSFVLSLSQVAQARVFENKYTYFNALSCI